MVEMFSTLYVCTAVLQCSTTFVLYLSDIVSHPIAVAMCPPLESPDNGDVSLTGMDVGSVATYTCDSGYFLVGSPERMCLQTGEWSEEEPSCSRSTLCGPVDVSTFIAHCFFPSLTGFEIEFVDDTPAVNGDTVTIVFSSTVPLLNATCSVTAQAGQDCELILRDIAIQMAHVTRIMNAMQVLVEQLCSVAYHQSDAGLTSELKPPLSVKLEHSQGNSDPVYKD